MEVVPGLHWVERIWDTKVYILVEGDRVVIVDAATPGRAGAVWAHLASLGYSPEAVDEIWLTHADIDHMGSVAALQSDSGAQVVAHRADVPLVEGLSDRQLGPLPLSGAYQRIFNWVVRRMFRPATVDRAVGDGEALGGWQVVHAPGHTPGSICFHHPSRGILLVGDALNHRRGRLGAPPPMFTSDMGQAHASIRRIAALDFEICCFGHGPPLSVNARERVRAFADSLI
ncbi:MAG: MBL fold metallo-hydrolase [Anaerolineae bacterium]|nr:MBL fold metallo-hydrolase [Anaerolineae bacterium]